jgi:hypothetical protein
LVLQTESRFVYLATYEELLALQPDNLTAVNLHEIGGIGNHLDWGFDGESRNLFYP